MKKRGVFLLYFLALFFILNTITFAHEGEEEHGDYNVSIEEKYQINTTAAAFFGVAVLAAFVIILIIFDNKLNEKNKKFLYVVFSVAIAAITIYFAATTVYINIVSATKGPVHWHADFEIWACGKKIDLVEPKGLLNKVGTATVHEHNDNRIHVEGVLLSKRDASIGAFFHAVNGYIDSSKIIVQTNDGVVEYENGNLCNNVPAKLYVFVNGNLIENPSEYVIAPYSNVPPGDTIKIIFK